MLMPIALRLAIRQWLARPLRPVLCSLAIAASVALIVCVGGAMDSLRATVGKAIGQALGVAEVHIRPAQRGTDARVPQKLLEQVRALPEIDFAGGRLGAKASLTHGDLPHWYDLVGIDPRTDDMLRPKIVAAGKLLTPASGDEIMVDQQVAKDLNAKVGDEVEFVVNDKPPRKLRIAAIIERPSIDLIARSTIYVPITALWRDLDIGPEYSVLDLKVKESSGITDFDQYSKDLGKKFGPAYDIGPGTNSKANMADMTRTLRLMLIMLSTVSAFCAALIIGTTLSVGVQERVRQFGQLRCIGASRGQLAAFLLGDAAVMLAVGAFLGILLGVGLSAALVAYFTSIFETFQLTPVSVAIACFCGGLATLLGAAIPIWQVTRVSPMAAVTAVANRASLSRVRLAGFIGLACLAAQMLLWFIPTSRDVRVFGYLFVGIPLIFAGWCLLSPLLVIFCERVGALVVGGLFFVKPSLLRHAWSRTPWRSGAMIASLMVGVTLFTTVRARGRSLMTSWTPPQIPDLVIKSVLGKLDAKQIERLRKDHPELRDIAPFDYFAVTMKAPDTHVGKALNEEETTFVAVEPEAFATMVPMDFVAGDPKQAVRELVQGRHVFVTKEFYNVRHLGLGDHLSFKAADGSFADFTIAAVVESTGVEVVKNYFDLRAAFGEKAVSSVLGTLSDARQYFKFGEPTLALVDVDPKAADPAKMDALRVKLAPAIQSLSSIEVKTTLARIIGRIMNGLSIIGLGALCVASLGVANMVIASVHARRYEFGVLRAIGAGRGQLVRLVLAEVTLVGILAGILGAGAGLTFAFMATRLDFLLIGLPVNFIDPEPLVAAAVGALLVVIAICLTTLLGWLAAIVPAIRGSMTAQRTLLAAGRV